MKVGSEHNNLILFLSQLTCAMVFFTILFGTGLFELWQDEGRSFLMLLFDTDSSGSSTGYDIEPLYDKVSQVVTAVEGISCTSLTLILVAHNML